MTGLLVSVRSAAEARDALAGGADLIDVKEPERGSLGRAEASVWRETAGVVAGRAPVSAALGELAEWTPRDGDLAELHAVQFAKLGLAGCGNLPDWPGRWAKAIAAFPSAVRPVAVSYADWRRVQAPSPEEVLATGRSLGCTAWLIDTCDKTRGGLLDHVSRDELAGWIEQARRQEMLTVVAGSLTPASIKTVLPLKPDYLAVRGAACRGGRNAVLDRDLVRRLAEAVAVGRKQVISVPRSLRIRNNQT
jgi:uncharacterized protein (UPF0264 family)